MFIALLANAAFALPLLVERFDTAPDGWKERVAAGKGGASGKIVIAEGVVTLTADKHTRRFVALGRRVTLRGYLWLDVSAKVTVTGLQNPADNAVCGVFIRFDTGETVPTRHCDARTDSEPHHRFIPIPAAARDMEVGVMLTTAGTVTVDDLLVATDPPDLKSVVRGSFNYRWLGNDSFRDDQLEANDGRFAELSAFFGVKAGSRLDYWKYKDAATLETFTGRRGDSVVSPTRVDTIFRNDTRALIESLSSGWGQPAGFVFEGLAVHLIGDWDGRDPRLATRTAVNGGTAPSLATLLDPVKFAAERPESAFTQAGAFMSWVVATRGVEAVKACFAGTSPERSAAENQAAIEAALGAPLAKLEADFRASL